MELMIFLSVFTTSGIQKIDRFQVFNRWGSVVFALENFAPNDKSIGWDSSYKGQSPGNNVFVYFVEYTNLAGYKRVVKGDVTVLR